MGFELRPTKHMCRLGKSVLSLDTLFSHWSADLEPEVKP
jgi:hypothetical protein